MLSWPFRVIRDAYEKDAFTGGIVAGAFIFAFLAFWPILIPLAVIVAIWEAVRAGNRQVSTAIRHQADRRRQQEVSRQRAIAYQQQAEYERLRPQREAEQKRRAIQEAIDEHNAAVSAANSVEDESMRYEIIGEAEIRLRNKLRPLL